MASTLKAKKWGRPTQSEAEELRRRIVSAGFTIFLRYGYEGSSLEQVAKLSGATRRSVVARFSDKEVLLVAVVEATMGDLVSRFDRSETMLSSKPLETLRDSCRTIFETVLTDEWVVFYRLCIAEAHKFPVVSAAFINFNNRIAADLQGLIERAQRSGALPDLDPASFATALIGAFISNPLNRRTLGDADFTKDDFRDGYFASLWKVMMHGLS